MSMREATRDEIAHWNELLQGAPAGLEPLQTTEYAQIKKGAWDARFMIHGHPGQPDVPVLYLVRAMKPFGQLWYAPMGPRVTDEAGLRRICDDLRSGPAFAVMMEPAIAAEGPQTRDEIVAAIDGMEPHPNIQPGVSTVFVDLRPSEEEILASFKQRARRFIRKSAEATIEQRDDDEALEQFWDLYVEMMQRAKLPLRPKSYYLDAWRLYLAEGKGALFLGRSSAELPHAEAGVFIVCEGDLGYYRDGGSVRTPGANGLQYRMQWEAMRWCKERGATRYDMFGAPPSWLADDETHQLHGLVQFKTAFAPIVDSVGAMRLVVNRPRTLAWDQVGSRIHRRLTAKTNPLVY